MLEKLFAIAALVGFVLFVGVLAVYVGEPDLYIVVGVGVAMAAYDFIRLMFLQKKPDE